MNYLNYQSLFQSQRAPFAFIDMNALDANIAAIIERSQGKSIRIATKSIRCRFIIDYILKKLPNNCGIMAFTVEEALWLAETGKTNILIGYPTFEISSIEKVISDPKLNKAICFMVDSIEHIKIINEIAAKNNAVANLCIDVDMSSSFPGIYFGVYRSSIKKSADLERFIQQSSSFLNIKVKGLMGYEAQIAGIGDRVQGTPIKNQLIRFLKRKSIKQIAKRRVDCINVLSKNNLTIDFVNGGGTGSIESTRKENGVTEITVGSGFYNSHLFDNYANFNHQPAIFYALRIVRKPSEGVFTALGGGYIASGATDSFKQPQPYLPSGMELLKNEGAGEVQTPFRYHGEENLKIGDVVFFRHAKAGELCERFNELLLVRNNEIEQIVPTYRGEQKCFL